jgi:hypothetical protein
VVFIVVEELEHVDEEEEEVDIPLLLCEVFVLFSDLWLILFSLPMLIGIVSFAAVAAGWLLVVAVLVDDLLILLVFV